VKSPGNRTSRMDEEQAPDDHPMAPRLLTVGHGTATRDEFAALLLTAGAQLVVDVRSAPGSRRFPQYRRAELAEWLPAAGIGYRWEPDLGGFRRPTPVSPNVSLRHPSFRAYADYMATEPFRQAMARLLGDVSGQVTAIMCAEALWWRCHRRLIADAATILCGAAVLHLGHDGRLSAHHLTEGVRHGPGGTLLYDLPGDPPASARTRGDSGPC
ncbi:MAG: DUF488 family protein, partial [Micromonosporaceae bacterium]